jgi:hypothetical protein
MAVRAFLRCNKSSVFREERRGSFLLGNQYTIPQAISCSTTESARGRPTRQRCPLLRRSAQVRAAPESVCCRQVYPEPVALVGRVHQLRAIDQLLERAADCSGGLLVFHGATGSGKTTLIGAAVNRARARGFQFLRASPPRGQQGRLVWAQLLRAIPGQEGLAAQMLEGPSLLELDSAAAELARGERRLIVLDDLDHGGQHAVDLLSILATRLANTSTAVIVTAYDALEPYRGWLVVLGGANTAWGPVSHYLGLLAAQLGRIAMAVSEFETAIVWAEQVGALPSLAHSLDALADTLDQRSRGDDRHRASEYRARARGLAERLGMPWLLQRLSASSDGWTLVRDGDDWLLEADSERVRLRDSRGLHYLRALLAAPARDIAALELVAGGGGLVASAVDPVLDAAAIAAYQKRLESLTAQLDTADRTGDLQLSERIGSERQALLGELRRVTGLGGRVRRTSPEAERARVNVTRTLRATVDRLVMTAPRAAAHLRASIRTGHMCCYTPAPGGPTAWRL